MKNKPFYLVLFPYLAFAIAIRFTLQIFLIYDIPLSEFERTLAMLTPLNLLTMAIMFVTGLLTMMMNRHVYKLIPALLLITLANNAVVGLYGSDYTLFQVALSFVLFGLSLKPFYSKEIKAVINEPRLRWWLTPTRYNMQKPIKIHSDRLQITSETLNMSKTGVFAKVTEDYQLDEIELDEILDLQILLDSPITLKARVVRKCLGTQNQPDGVGLEIIKDQYHKREYLPWLKQAVTT